MALRFLEATPSYPKHHVYTPVFQANLLPFFVNKSFNIYLVWKSFVGFSTLYIMFIIYLEAPPPPPPH